MASRFTALRLPVAALRRSSGAILVSTLLLLDASASAQVLLKPSQPGELVTLLPSDVAIFEAPPRKDLPCTVDSRKPELGFDLRFHSGFDVSVPLRELAGAGEM